MRIRRTINTGNTDQIARSDFFSHPAARFVKKHFLIYPSVYVMQFANIFYMNLLLIISKKEQISNFSLPSLPVFDLISRIFISL